MRPPHDPIFYFSNAQSTFAPSLEMPPPQSLQHPPVLPKPVDAQCLGEETEEAPELIPIYDINGRVSYRDIPSKPRIPLPFESNYPLPPSVPVYTPAKSDPLSVPTLKESLSTAAMHAFAKSLDEIDPRIRAKLDQPFGKDSVDRCFRTEPRLRHVLLPLWKSGFMYQAADEWQNLAIAYPEAATLLQLIDEYGDIQFGSLQGFPSNWNAEVEVNETRVKMTTAALMHFNGSAADCVRWIGGPHVGAHRDNDTIFRRLRLAGVPLSTYNAIKRIYTSGIPNALNATSTEANFQAFLAYGNHRTVEEDPQKTLQALIKDNKRGYTLLFDQRLVPFLLQCHVTPQGVVDLDAINKNPRPIFDSSFRPYPWCQAINDWTSKDTEPPLTFAEAELNFMIWVYNLRISYPNQEIYLADDDVSGAFRHGKYTPNAVALHTSIQCGYAVLNTGTTFGDNTSPSNFDPQALARRYLSQYLWLNDPSVVDRALRALPPIQLEDPPTDAVAQTFRPAHSDSLNLGVFDHNGDRRPPPYPMHVDDNLYADIAEYLERSVAASAAGLFDLLGWPDPRVPLPLSLDKFEAYYNHKRRMVGRAFDSRRLSVGMLPYKRTALSELLLSWLQRSSFSLPDIANLIGILEFHTRYARWARCWYFAVQNTARRILHQRFYALKRLQNRFRAREVELRAVLPGPMLDRLSSIVAREKALFLWNSRVTFTVTQDLQDDVMVLY